MFKKVSILAHRGAWRTAAEKNSFVAFQRAFRAGFGVETDVRDHNGVLVIDHDLPNDDSMTLDDFLELYRREESRAWLALNIKADGLAALVEQAMMAYCVTHYFCFDMSIPDTFSYLKKGLSFYSRHSEVEPVVPFAQNRKGVWFDAFGENELDIERAIDCLSKGDFCSLVSPELHGRTPEGVWEFWRSKIIDLPSDQIEKLQICTDLPEEAFSFFRRQLDD